jgi:hypothetical protein
MTDIADRVVHTDLSMQIVARDKSVHLLFSRDLSDGAKVPAMTDNMALDPETALMASQVLADMAFEADEGLRMPKAQQLALIERHRAKLLPRITVMFNSLREKKTMSNEELARQVLDTFCAEVFS